MNQRLTSVDDMLLACLRDELNPAQQEKFRHWLESDSKNQQYFNELLEVWMVYKASANPFTYDSKKGFNNFLKRINQNSNKKAEKNYLRRFFIKSARYAAIFLFILLSGYFLVNYFAENKPLVEESSYTELVVPRGSRAHFVLSDGTKVTMNAGSLLRYKSGYGKEHRNVELEGEAYFIVAKNPLLEFNVLTPLVIVKALGTEFNIKAYPGEKAIETTLVKGLVKVELINKPSQTEDILLKPDQKLTISYQNEDQESLVAGVDEPAESGSLDNIRKAVDVNHIQAFAPASVDVIPIISWKEKKWVIEDENLHKLAIELERRYDVQVIFQSETLKRYRFSGTLLDEPLEQVLKAISLTSPVTFSLEGRNVILNDSKNQN